MRVLVICGLGGAGKEILDLVQRINEGLWNDIVFCDKEVRFEEFRGCKVFDFEQIGEIYKKGEVEFIISNGDISIRRKIYEEIIAAGFALATVVAKGVYVPKTTHLGAGVIIRDNVYMSVDCDIDDNVMIQPNVVVGHDTHIGKNSIVAANSTIGGGTSIGNNSYVALGCIIKEMTEIGDNVLISMGGCVNKKAEADSIYGGNPATKISRNFLKSAFDVNKMKS